MSKLWYLMEIAILTSKRSTCERLNVGCVLADPSYETFVVGYNGTYKGGPNHCLKDPNVPGGCGCVHAEVNAIAKAGRGHKIAFLTHAPCHVCATLLVNADTQFVYYNKVYRTTEGLQLLHAAGVSYKWFVGDKHTFTGVHPDGTLQSFYSDRTLGID
jgi:dCMP deaminase